MSDGYYLPGRVVVERVEHTGSGSRRRRVAAWTLHVLHTPSEPDCLFAVRAEQSGTALPAPATPYEGTIDCTYCKPSGEHRNGEPTEQHDGTWAAPCRCGMVGTGPSEPAARHKLRRMHRGQPGRVAAPEIVGHKVTLTAQADGTGLATCECGEFATGLNKEAARVRLYRAHRRHVAHPEREAS